jgi:hypothetical protein
MGVCVCRYGRGVFKTVPQRRVGMKCRSGVGVELMLLVTVGVVVLNCPCVRLAKVFRSRFGRLRGRCCRRVGWWVQDSARS